MGNLMENILKMWFLILNKAEDILTANSLLGDPESLLVCLDNGTVYYLYKVE